MLLNQLLQDNHINVWSSADFQQHSSYGYSNSNNNQQSRKMKNLKEDMTALTHELSHLIKVSISCTSHTSRIGKWIRK